MALEVLLSTDQLKFVCLPLLELEFNVRCAVHGDLDVTRDFGAVHGLLPGLSPVLLNHTEGMVGGDGAVHAGAYLENSDVCPMRLDSGHQDGLTQPMVCNFILFFWRGLVLVSSRTSDLARED